MLPVRLQGPRRYERLPVNLWGPSRSERPQVALRAPAGLGYPVICGVPVCLQDPSRSERLLVGLRGPSWSARLPVHLQGTSQSERIPVGLRGSERPTGPRRACRARPVCGAPVGLRAQVPLRCSSWFGSLRLHLRGPSWSTRPQSAAGPQLILQAPIRSAGPQSVSAGTNQGPCRTNQGPRKRAGPRRTGQGPERRIRALWDGLGPCGTDQSPEGQIRAPRDKPGSTGDIRAPRDEPGPAERTRALQDCIGCCALRLGSAHRRPVPGPGQRQSHSGRRPQCWVPVAVGRAADRPVRYITLADNACTAKLKGKQLCASCVIKMAGQIRLKMKLPGEK